jgi:glycosyltransferase involved in cell wall biosynthesis
MMKVCFVCPEYPPGPHGGIGTLTQVMARNLVQSGHQVRVIGVYDAAYPSADYEEDQGVQVWRLREPKGPLGWLRGRLQLFSIIRRWSRQRVVDLVEVPDYRGDAAGWPALPVPVVTRLSGSASYFATEMGKQPQRTRFYLERASVRRSNFWCSESRYMAERTQRLFGLRAQPDAIIYNPVELPRDTRESLRVRNRIVFAGTLTKKKGIVSLVQAWPRVKASSPEAELHIWGKDGRHENGASMREFLQSLIPDSLAGSVQFHGHVPLDELLAAFQTAGLVVLPSYAEGFALTPLHAMAAGCPVVYTSRGSGPELIEHGRDGLLIDPDRPDEIADAIVGLLKNEALAQHLGRAGRQKVKDCFSWKTLLGQNLGFYEECLRKFREPIRA